MDRESANLSEKSLRFYGQKITPFLKFLLARGITDVSEISPDDIRAFLVGLKGDHTPGGVHAFYRAIKAFCRWLYDEGKIPADVMRRIKAPKVPGELLEPVPPVTVQALLQTCDLDAWIGARDYALILMLLDTGLRASELLSVNVADLDLESGKVLVRKTKGGKPRAAFVGETTRAALARYLGFKPLDYGSALRVAKAGTRLSYTGLRDIIRRRAKQAGVAAPSLHSFRRGFALTCLRSGMDIFSLQKLMGHSDLSVLRRYLAQTSEDLHLAHQHVGPVDHLTLCA